MVLEAQGFTEMGGVMRGNFDEAFRLLMKLEGGYVNDKDDPGGETKYGISKRAYPDLDIKNLTLEDAKAIYRRDFWVKLRCGDLPAGIDITAFIFAVNAGVKAAGVYLQRAANEVAGRSLLKVDGIVGPHTVRVVNNLPVKSVLLHYTVWILWHYHKISKSGSLEKFLRGWFKRAIVTHTKAVEMQLTAWREN